MNEEYVLYILMRTDLPSMNSGKAMAQAAHAANMLSDIATVDGPIVEGYADWMGDRSFGTTIVLAATENQIDDMLEKAYQKNIISKAVWDPTYPYQILNDVLPLIDKNSHTADPIVGSSMTTCFRKELTCSWVFCRKSDLPELSSLKLHP